MHDGGQGDYDAGIETLNTKGLFINYKRAAKRFSKAALQGHPAAQYELAFLYQEGNGVEQEQKRAAHWLSCSARAGYAPAQWALGAMHAQGRNAKKGIAPLV